MKKHAKNLLSLLAVLLLSAGLLAESLARPAWVKVADGAKPKITWASVEGARLYRLAVFGQPDEEGKRPLMGAAWLKGQAWSYGAPASVAKAAKLPSTVFKDLEKEKSYRVMVSAAKADGSNKSDWTAADFSMNSKPSSELNDAGAHGSAPEVSPTAEAVDLASVPTFTATPSPTATESVVDLGQAQNISSSAEAEVVVDLSSEFKETPEAVASSPTPAPSAMDYSNFTLSEARALLAEKKYVDAQAAFKAWVDKDATSADAWEGLGDAYDGRLMKIEAKEAYEKAWSLDDSRLRIKEWLDKNVRR